MPAKSSQTESDGFTADEVQKAKKAWLDERGEPNILEVNPLPGILPKPEDNSCLPKAARTAGYTYDGLILRVADEAAARWGLAVGGRA